MSKPNTAIFVHIPKTAGRTLESILERQYPASNIYNLYGYQDSIPEAAKKLEGASESEKRKIQLVKGHYEFGLNECLPQSSSYITMLRDPIDRVISLYYYILANEGHPHREKIMTQNLDLKSYVESGISSEVDNGQTRLISGMEGRYSFGQCEPDLLEKAKSNIERHFAVAGLVEQFDESIVLMKLALGWESIWYNIQNVSSTRPKRGAVSEETLKVIREYNALDIELVRYARERLAKALIEHGPKVNREIKLLHSQNRRQNRCLKIHKFLKRGRGRLRRIFPQT